MAYKIIFTVRSLNEIENAVDFYKLYSQNAPTSFIEALEKANNSLAINPFYPIRYKNVRALKLDKFPFLLYYVINEKKLTVRILSCFHSKRNPIYRPKN